MKDVLNAAVKFREEFRPFAPSVTVEDAPRFFEIDRPSPYMILVHRVRSEVRDLIPAVIHVDGTARVHTVSEDVNSRYYRLLRKFAVLTGIPVIVNTSFNVRGQPIVRTPEDALRTFFSTGLDVLAIGDFVVEKY
jgi:carbamoyltransferase